MTDTIVRIRAKTVSMEPGACWVFASAPPGGYGRVGLNGRTYLVHRLAYSLLVGPIPEDLDLDHLCRNRSCWNPEHLEPVTRAENLRRGHGVAVAIQRRADANRGKTHCDHGHPFTAKNTRIRANGSRACRACMKRRSRECYLRKIARRAGGGQ